MSKKEFEALVKLILSKTGLKNQEELSEDSGRNKGYISQILSRGKIPDKYVELLRIKYLNDSPSPDMEVIDVAESIRKIQASNDVILLAVAELLAKANNQPIAVVVGQLEDLVKSRLK